MPLILGEVLTFMLFHKFNPLLSSLCAPHQKPVPCLLQGPFKIPRLPPYYYHWRHSHVDLDVLDRGH